RRRLMRVPFTIATALVATLILTHRAPAQQGIATVSTSRITDSDYVRQTAATDMFEIEAGDIALKRSKNAEIWHFAQQMIYDHTSWTKRLTKLLQISNVNIAPPTKLNEQHQQMLERLRTLSSGFNRHYIEMQVEGHRHALEIQKAYGQTGSNPKLREFAAMA